jgi:hypothetical protein
MRQRRVIVVMARLCHSPADRLEATSPRFQRSIAVKNILLLVLGVGAGFVIAHQVSKTEKGQQFFADVDSRAKEFSAALVDGYRTREAELRAAVEDVEDAVSKFRNR